MCAQKVATALIIVCISSFLAGCGELDTVLPSAGTYRVNARVNDAALDDCSLVNAKDRIYPYFDSSVAADPDLTGLAVFLQTPSGQGVGKKIRYTLKADAPGQEDTPSSEQNPGEEAGQPPAESDQTGAEGQKADAVTDGGAEDQADGNRQTGQHTASAAPDAQMTETETLIAVDRLDRDLPFFVLPEKLDMGLYVMVFQVLGKNEVLYREEKIIYYLENTRFSLIDIQRYLPDVSGSHLIPPGTTVMLEAQVEADARLDPYIIWYNGRRRIGEGSLAGGGAFILWKAPEQNGFYTIRAEIFPQRPVDGLYGKFREISLPISAKAASAGYFSGEAERIAYWYQFQGNLRDSQASAGINRPLISQTQGPPRWMPEHTVYGLKVGAGDVYRLSSFSFVSEDPSLGKKQEAGRFMLRFKPTGEGTVFSACFEAGNPSGRVYLDLNFSGKSLGLNISGLHESAAAALDYSPGEEDDFITLYVDFAVHDGVFEAGFGTEDGGSAAAELKRLTLLDSLTGTGTFQFGASLKPPGAEKSDTGLLAEKPVPHLAILDEFALAFLRRERRGGHVVRNWGQGF
ncbi:MAG: hypothetical protein LBO65_01675 [Spirochaetaceae bacterium]|jgi:hypothetical protein|nr:hypothetical protein [Spirochaetaceae bacterium]